MPPASASQSVFVNLVENATFAEVFLLRFCPAAENVVDREQLDLCLPGKQSKKAKSAISIAIAGRRGGEPPQAYHLSRV
jgi:hypothetical protein